MQVWDEAAGGRSMQVGDVTSNPPRANRSATAHLGRHKKSAPWIPRFARRARTLCKLATFCLIGRSPMELRGFEPNVRIWRVHLTSPDTAGTPEERGMQCLLSYDQTDPRVHDQGSHALRSNYSVGRDAQERRRGLEWVDTKKAAPASLILRAGLH